MQTTEIIKKTDTPINVWKIAINNSAQYAVVGYIPVGVEYYIEDHTKDCFTYVSKFLYITDIGTFILNGDEMIFQSLDLELIPLINQSNENIVYKKNSLISSKTGLWSYKDPWQVAWIIVNNPLRYENKLSYTIKFYNITYNFK
jgi:hypothetical protein